MDCRTFMEQQMRLDYFQWINMDNRAFLTDLLQNLIAPDPRDDAVLEAGRTVFERKISFSKLAIFLDIYAEELDAEERKRLRRNENLLARGYLKARLPGEIRTIRAGLHHNPNFIGKGDLAIIAEMVEWMEKMVNAFMHDTAPPPFTSRADTFDAFVYNRSGVFFDDPDVLEDFVTTNHQLYDCAQEAINFFKRGEYFHFTLIYLELVALFLKLATLLGNMFLEEELLSLYVDPVTALPNRFQLIKDLEIFGRVYLLIVNIKGFSRLNVLYGYDIGDAILKKSALYLKNSGAIKCYRIYGDEFAVLVHNRNEAHELFERLNGALSVTVEGTEFDIYFYGAGDVFGDKALERCEFALINGPKRGIVQADNVEEMMRSYKREMTLTQKLKEIMLQDAIVPYFQPIYANDTINKVIKYEVLMRLRYQDEILSPGEFLSTLKEAPFYTEFTKSVLLKAFETFSRNDLPFSVNFTLTDIHDKGVRLFLEGLAAQYPDTAKRLTIEITEAEALREFDRLNDFIRAFKRHGITFSLDDFGSGYSNFAQFARLEIDYIKIDGSIIQEILGDEKMRKLLDSILEFARNFELGVIAEYVCSKELFEALKGKVDMLQGYYIGEPRPYLDEPFKTSSSQTNSADS